MIAPELLELIPDDDPTYLTALQRCQTERMHPAVAAIQAHIDLNHRTRRKDRCPMTAQRKPIRHGTNAGYQTHLRRGIEPCDNCLAAHREYQRVAAEPAEPAAAGRTCPTCGRIFHPKGINRHEQACAERHGRLEQAVVHHQTGITTIAEPRAPQARLPKHFGRVEPAVHVRLECECGHHTDNVTRLIEHTLTTHGRGPTRTERTPRTHRKDIA